MPGYFISNVFVCIYIYLLLNTAKGENVIRGYNIITMGSKPFMKLYISFTNAAFDFTKIATCSSQVQLVCIY